MRTRDVLQLAQPSLRLFLPGVLAALISSVSAVALLGTSAYLITRASEQVPLLFLSLAVVGVRFFALARAVFRYLHRLLSHQAVFRTLAEVRVSFYRRLIPLAPVGLNQTGRGSLLTGLVDDVDELQNFPLRVIQPLVTSLTVAVLSVLAASLMLPLAGVIFAAALIFATLSGVILDAIVGAKAERAISPLRADCSDRTLDIVSRLDLLIAYDALDDYCEDLEKADNRLSSAVLRRALSVGIVSVVLTVSAAGASVALLASSIPQLHSGQITAPVFVVIALLPFAVFDVFAMAPLAVGAFGRVRASAQRIANIIPAQIPAHIPRDTSEPIIHPDPLGSAESEVIIECSELSPLWPQPEEQEISPLSFQICRGDRILLTGVSGSGKTALANVLVRFLEYRGHYRISGVEVRQLSHDYVRSLIGLCEQNPYLFDSDVRQNLLFAKDTASDQEILAVLDRVGLASWVTQIGGLDALVGEHGSLISGGQAQRIGYARLLLADFPVVILDEPTAHVDAAHAEKLIRDLLSEARDSGQTVLLISHLPVPRELLTKVIALKGN